MRKVIFILAALAVIGVAYGQNFIQGEAKGPDAPGAMLIGSGDQVSGLLNVSGLSIDAVNQAFGIDAVELSGTDPSVFEQPWLRKDGWVSDGGSYGRTPSQTKFINDRTGENLIFIPRAR